MFQGIHGVGHRQDGSANGDWVCTKQQWVCASCGNCTALPVDVPPNTYMVASQY